MQPVEFKLFCMFSLNTNRTAPQEKSLKPFVTEGFDHWSIVARCATLTSGASYKILAYRSLIKTELPTTSLIKNYFETSA